MLLIVKTPFESLIGLFLFATHTTVSGFFTYHIPKYLFLELPGEKKPSSNFWLVETKVSPSLRDLFGPKVSAPMENFKKAEENKKAWKRERKAWIFIAVSR